MSINTIGSNSDHFEWSQILTISHLSKIFTVNWRECLLVAATAIAVAGLVISIFKASLFLSISFVLLSGICFISASEMKALGDLRGIVTDLSHENNALKMVRKQLFDGIAALRSEIQQLHETNRAISQNVTRLETTNNNLEANNTRFEQQNLELARQLQVATEHSKHITEALTTLVGQLQEKKDAIGEQGKQTFEMLQKSIQEVNIQIGLSSTILNQINELQTQQFDRLSQQIREVMKETLTHELQQTALNLAETKAIYAEIKKLIEMAKTDLQDLKDQFSREISEAASRRS